MIFGKFFLDYHKFKYVLRTRLDVTLYEYGLSCYVLYVM
jgi:hypothetical protein